MSSDRPGDRATLDVVLDLEATSLAPSVPQAGPEAAPYFTPAERAARGKAARADIPRSAHGDWQPPPNRPDPLELLEEQARTRLPELIPIRYGRMLVSPFTFFRGAAYVMAADLADGPRTGLYAQLCGDAHLCNFGIFAAPDRKLVFSINDFDETLPGPFEWDVKRLAASIAVAGRDRGFDEQVRRSVVMSALAEYRRAMTQFAGMNTLDVWYIRLDVERMLDRFAAELTPKQTRRLQAEVGQLHTKDNLRALAKLCGSVGGEVRIIGHPPLVTPIEDVLPGAEQAHLEDTVRRMIDTYRSSLPHDRQKLLGHYRYVHAARKVVGVGSVGTRAWVLLLIGRDDSDPLFLQRIVAIDGQTKDFYIRQLWDAKGSAEIELMNPAGLAAYGIVCGWTLAKAHARSGDPMAIAAYLGTSDSFDRAVASFAETYADQNERDYEALRQAAASGRVAVQSGL